MEPLAPSLKLPCHKACGALPWVALSVKGAGGVPDRAAVMVSPVTVPLDMETVVTGVVPGGR